MFEKQKKYRVLTVHVNDNVMHNYFKKAVYKETHEGTFESFDDSPFEPTRVNLDVMLDWLQRGGGDLHGYDWEVTEA